MTLDIFPFTDHPSQTTTSKRFEIQIKRVILTLCSIDWLTSGFAHSATETNFGSHFSDVKYSKLANISRSTKKLNQNTKTKPMSGRWFVTSSSRRCANSWRWIRFFVKSLLTRNAPCMLWVIKRPTEFESQPFGIQTIRPKHYEEYS